MDTRLKLKLKEAVEAALATWKKRGMPKSKKAPGGTKPLPYGTNTESETLTRHLSTAVRQRLRKESLWGKVKEALADEALNQIFRGKLRGQPVPDDTQLSLPGFEHCPKTLGSGKYRVRLPQVPVRRFLKFEARYQTRAERNKQAADELHRLAEMVRPLGDTDPELLMGEAMKRAKTTDVVVIQPRMA